MSTFLALVLTFVVGAVVESMFAPVQKVVDFLKSL